MPGVLLDAGPLVAYLLERDNYHDWAVAAFADLELPAVSCEAVLSEASFLVGRTGRPAALVLDYAIHSGIRIGLQLGDEMSKIRDLMRQYDNVPMSLANASLVRLAELTGLPICTLDSDFAIYRARGRHPLTLISPERHWLHEP